MEDLAEQVQAVLSDPAQMARVMELAGRRENAGRTIVALLPDTGDRYLSTQLFAE